MRPPRGLQLGLAVLLVAGLLGVTAAQAASLLRGEVVTPQPPTTFHEYRFHGPSAEYGSDFGSIGVMRPVRVVLTQRSDVVVSFSFAYRSSRDPFVASLQVQGGKDRWRDTTPDRRQLRVARRGDSTTLQFLVSDLPAGTYRFSLGVNAGGGWRPPAKITTKQVLISGTVTPSAG